jgi:hypothetical protein
VQAKVPVGALAFGVLGGATFVRIPRINGHFRAQTACIGEGIGRNGRHSSLSVGVWLESLSCWRVGRGCVCVKSFLEIAC